MARGNEGCYDSCSLQTDNVGAKAALEGGNVLLKTKENAVLRVLHWACRIILAGVFLYSGYIKVQSPLAFAAALYGYQLFPVDLITPLTYYFPWVEISLGALLLIGWKMRYIAAGATGLVSTFIVLLTVTYLRGIDAECGCFGFGDRISPLTITRDGLILLPALFLATEARIRARLRLRSELESRETGAGSRNESREAS